jgi:excisionase family DNA binding protein
MKNIQTRNLLKRYEKREALRNLGFLVEKIIMETIESTENFKLLTEKEAAKVLKMSYSKIKSLRQQKKIGFVRFGCSIRYKLTQLQKFVELGIIEAKN